MLPTQGIRPQPRMLTIPPVLVLLIAAWPVTADETQRAGATADAVEIDGRTWAATTNGENVPWADADRYCRDLTLNGRTDWRLPTMPELETLYDPNVDSGFQIRQPIRIDACCLWSSTTLAELPEDNNGGTANDPSRYMWGFLFDAGIRYYSFMNFPDGQALCTRDG